jgi:predicted Zn-dependent protease
MPQGARLNIAPEPLGSVDMAIAHAKRLLEKNPDLAEEQAREILNADPAHPAARLILGAAQRRGGRARQALDVLEPLGRELPHAAPVYLELGVARAEAGHLPEAIVALRRAVQLQPGSADGWRFLADYLEAAGDPAGAGDARVRYVAAAAHDPRLKEAAAALMRNDLPLADRRLRAHLGVYPTDVAALRMLAEVAGRLRNYAEAQELLERCLGLAPEFDAARQNYAGVLNRQAKPAAALPHAERLLAKDAGNPG